MVLLFSSLLGSVGVNGSGLHLGILRGLGRESYLPKTQEGPS